MYDHTFVDTTKDAAPTAPGKRQAPQSNTKLVRIWHAIILIAPILTCLDDYRKTYSCQTMHAPLCAPTTLLHLAAGTAVLSPSGRDVHDHHPAQIPSAGGCLMLSGRPPDWSWTMLAGKSQHIAASKLADHANGVCPTIQDAEGSGRTHRKHLRLEFDVLRDQVPVFVRGFLM